jgi:endonuclease III
MFIKTLPNVNVQRLFGVALAIKILLSIASVLAKSPLILGLVLPLLVMVAYIIIGYCGRDSEVSEERFADSCYYIGFIFTITSIVASLFDLQNLTGPEGMHNISLRFGAAMVSTVIGMSVRVYLVSFRKNADDAVRDAESAVLDAVRVFITQLNVAVDNLRQFEQQVVDSTKLTVEHVNQQVESIGKQYAQSLNGFYTSLTSENKAALETLIGEVRVSTNKLADSVDTYSGGVISNLEGIERKVTDFADAVGKRLATTTFPDDYFVRELRGPLNLLKDEATLLGDSVRAVSSEVEASSETLSDVLKRITGKSKKSEAAMDAVVSLSEQHQTIVTNAGIQLASLVSLGERLAHVDLTLRSAQDAFGANANASHGLMARIASLAGESAELRSEIKDSFSVLVDKLDANATLATNVIKKLEDQTAELVETTDDLLAGLDAQVAATSEVALRICNAGAVTEATVQRLQDTAATNAEVVAAARETVGAAMNAARLTSDATQQITEVARRVETSVGQGIQTVQHLETLEATRNSLASLESKSLQNPKHDPAAEETATQAAVVSALTNRAAASSANQIELPHEEQTAAPFVIAADEVAFVTSAGATSADVVAVAASASLTQRI